VRVLLDSHAVLWWDSAEERLSAPIRDLLRDGGTEVLVSVASLWEIAIKVAKVSLELPSSPEHYLPDRLRKYRWVALPIEVDHALRAAALPRIHADPFDRLLVAQSQVEALPLVTGDPAITRYDVETIW
jgi:PIN domain nuclease of toxin-antitoxin system